MNSQKLSGAVSCLAAILILAADKIFAPVCKEHGTYKRRRMHDAVSLLWNCTVSFRSAPACRIRSSFLRNTRF